MQINPSQTATRAVLALTVLTAQRSLYAAEQALISLQLSDANNRITLYKVLGGGWQPDAANAS